MLPWVAWNLVFNALWLHKLGLCAQCGLYDKWYTIPQTAYLVTIVSFDSSISIANADRICLTLDP